MCDVIYCCTVVQVRHFLQVMNEKGLPAQLVSLVTEVNDFFQAIDGIELLLILTACPSFSSLVKGSPTSHSTRSSPIYSRSSAHASPRPFTPNPTKKYLLSSTKIEKIVEVIKLAQRLGVNNYIFSNEFWRFCFNPNTINYFAKGDSFALPSSASSFLSSSSSSVPGADLSPDGAVPKGLSPSQKTIQSSQHRTPQPSRPNHSSSDTSPTRYPLSILGASLRNTVKGKQHQF